MLKITAWKQVFSQYDSKDSSNSFVEQTFYFDNTVDSRYLEFQGTHCDISRYPYFDISELREWGKQ